MSVERLSDQQKRSRVYRKSQTSSPHLLGPETTSQHQDPADTLCQLHLESSIGVASYGALGYMPLDFQLFNFSGHQSCINSGIRLRVVAHPEKIYWHIAFSLFIA